MHRMRTTTMMTMMMLLMMKRRMDLMKMRDQREMTRKANTMMRTRVKTLIDKQQPNTN